MAGLSALEREIRHHKRRIAWHRRQARAKARKLAERRIEILSQMGIASQIDAAKENPHGR